MTYDDLLTSNEPMLWFEGDKLAELFSLIDTGDVSQWPFRDKVRSVRAVKVGPCGRPWFLDERQGFVMGQALGYEWTGYERTRDEEAKYWRNRMMKLPPLRVTLGGDQ